MDHKYGFKEPPHNERHRNFFIMQDESVGILEAIFQENKKKLEGKKKELQVLPMINFLRLREISLLEEQRSILPLHTAVPKSSAYDED